MPTPQDCPKIECWQALFDGLVPPDQQEYYERHLESCPACQERLDRTDESENTLRRQGQRIGDPTAVPVDPILTQIMEQLHEVKSPLDPTPTEPADLYFLRPADRPDILGMLGVYEVEEVIGQGGMGIVLKAFDPALHRLVAIKIMAAAVAGSATARQRFTREAKAAAAVCHEHIVTIHGVFEMDGLPYLVMHYVAGESLQTRLDRSGPLELADIVRIGQQTASGLAAAHAQRLIHRDIKPANLLLENGATHIRITDFGLARMTDDVQLTQKGTVAGTPEYMAPEQARGEPVDHRADLFSLGSVLYALCTGVAPFRGSSAVAVLRQVSDQSPTPLQELNPNVPDWLAVFIGRLMAKNPSDRFQSAAEVAQLLEAYLAHLRQPTTVPAPELPYSPLTVQTGRPKMPPRMFPRKWFLVAAVGIVSLCGLLGAIAASVLNNGDTGSLNLGGIGTGVLRSNEHKTLEPKNGVVCLLVNKNSGRCLSIANKATNPGARIVQGPMPDQAGPAERWMLLGTDKTFRLRNESSHLVLEIGSANLAAGVQAIQWHDQPPKANQLWTFEPTEDGYVLRVGHSQLVLGIGQSSLDEGGRAIQWNYVPDVTDQMWELRPTTAAASGGGSTPAQLSQEDFWSLKGEPKDRELFELTGPDAEQCMHFQPDGLRITLPLDYQGQRPGTGVTTGIAVKGDFEITVTFEILREPQPADAGLIQTLFSLDVDLDKPVNNYATIARRQTRGGTQFLTWMSLQDEEASKPRTSGKGFPTEAKSGRLRLVRTGSVLSYYVSEGSNSDFILLQQYPFGVEDLKGVRLIGSTGGPQAALDVRVTDLRIRTASLPDLPAATPLKIRGNWFAAAELFGLLLTFALLSGLGVWLYLRHSRRVATRLASAAGPDVPAESVTATPPISFQCSACGKNLRAKTELAGKKVKCSQCGKPVLVP